MEFVARVAEPTGVIADRPFTAENEAALRLDLERRGLHVFRIRAKRGSMFRQGVRRVDGDDFLAFNQELVALLKAGLPLLQCLSLLSERRKDVHFRDILRDVESKVKGGTALSDAFATHGAAFPSVYAPSVLAGEKSGNLEAVLRRYVAYAQVIGAVRRKVTAALVYPVVLLSLSAGLIAILVTYVIPKFSAFYRDFDARLPWITQTLITVSSFARDQAALIVVLLVAAAAAFRMAVLHPKALQWRDQALLRLPVMGDVMLKYAVSQFARTLATLLAGGLPLLPALQIASGAVSNAHVGATLMQVTDAVREGAPLTESLDKTGLWSDTTLQMVRVGESAGALTEMLANVADFYDAEVDRRVQTFVTLLEPALLVIMGLMVSGMLLAMYYPLFTLIQVVQ